MADPAGPTVADLALADLALADPALARALGDFAPPPLSCGFADRIVALALAEGPPAVAPAAAIAALPPLRGRSPRRWLRGGLAGAGIIAAGMVSLSAAAFGYLGEPLRHAITHVPGVGAAIEHVVARIRPHHALAPPAPPARMGSGHVAAPSAAPAPALPSPPLVAPLALPVSPRAGGAVAPVSGTAFAPAVPGRRAGAEIMPPITPRRFGGAAVRSRPGSAGEEHGHAFARRLGSFGSDHAPETHAPATAPRFAPPVGGPAAGFAPGDNRPERREETLPRRESDTDRAGTDRGGAERAGTDRTGTDRTGIDRSGAERAGAERTGPGATAEAARPQPGWRRQGGWRGNGFGPGGWRNWRQRQGEASPAGADPTRATGAEGLTAAPDTQRGERPMATPGSASAGAKRPPRDRPGRHGGGRIGGRLGGLRRWLR